MVSTFSDNDSNSVPKDWQARFQSRLDFDASYAELERYEFFHSYAHRGNIRRLQGRVPEAVRHLDTACRLYAEVSDPGPQDQLRYYYVKSYRLTCAFVLERAGVAPPEDTDLVLRELLEVPVPDLHVVAQYRTYAGGLLSYFREDFEAAIHTFELLLSESEARFENQRFLFAQAHSAAAWQLGRRENAERSYENAALMVGLLDGAFRIAYSSQLMYAQSRYLDWSEEAERWNNLLWAQPCTAQSKRELLACADRLVADSKRRKSFLLS